MQKYVIIDVNSGAVERGDRDYPDIASLVSALELRLVRCNLSWVPSREVRWAWQPRALTTDGAPRLLTAEEKAAFDAAWQEAQDWAWKHIER